MNTARAPVAPVAAELVVSVEQLEARIIELERLLRAQRRIYGDAFDKVVEMLVRCGHTHEAAAVRGLRDVYGFEPLPSTPSVRLAIAPARPQLSQQQLLDEALFVLRSAPGQSLLSSQIQDLIGRDRINEAAWRQVTEALRRDHRIVRRGTGPVTAYALGTTTRFKDGA